MKPGDLLGEQFRVEAPLRGRGREGGFLVTERRRGRQPRWVLKKLPFLRGRIPRDRLRNDILEVASLKHERLLLPSFFGLDPRRQMAFLLRPYVAGSDLLSAGETRSVREIIPWMIAAAEALGLLHSFGLLHRNVKASNFIVQRKALFSRQPREAAVCLSDPAWWPDGEGARGKMEAVAPELRAGAHATPASDLYALGSVFYQLLTQRTPQLGKNRFPPPPTQHDPELPLDAERVVMKLLNPEPARRYQDARAVADDLRRLPGPKAPDPPVAPDAFLGRARELSLVLKSLREKGRPSVVAISGEAGVGKSAFLRRLGLEAQLEGHRTVSWRCFHDGFLRQKAAAMDDGGGGKALLKDLPEIFSRRSAEEPCLFLVDDAHLADASTVDFLASRVRALRRRLAREPFAGTCPPSLAISFRNESPFRSILRPLLDAFGSPQDGSSLVLQLSGLDGPTVENWLERALGPRKLQDQVEVLRVSGGNPFAIREAIRLSSSGRSLASSALRDLELVHRGYLSSLDEEQRRILQALAIVARPSPPALLSRLALLPGPRVRSRLRLLLQDGTLLDGGGKIFFQHGSFQAWLLQDLPEKEQQRLHRRVASALGRRRTASVDEVASH